MLRATSLCLALITEGRTCFGAYHFSHAGSAAEANGLQEGEGQSVANVALLEKHAKTRLAVAADHFNRDYKKGFQFLQVPQL